MKTKSFQTYLEKRLTKKEITEIEKMAALEKKIFQNLQNDIVKIVTDYMKHEDIGFNELVNRLGTSPSQISKIKKGEANLTIASLAHIFALMKKQARITAC